MAGKQVVFRVKRYRPEGGGEPTWQEYTIPYTDDMVVLDGLNYIKDQVDPTLTFRWSCRMGICGSCGARVNGAPVLTCGLFIKDVRGRTVVVEPMSNFPIIKDLVVEFDDFMDKLQSVKPFLVREAEKPVAEGEYLQTPEEVDAYKQQSMCINCMLCYSACPVYGASDHFIGPAASALAYRYIRDSRDEGAEDRLHVLSRKTGIWECTFVGECSVVCPKDVDPAGAIQNLKVLASMRQMRRLLLPKSARR
ncbi:MAG: fumarate reductase [Euryarchaeota archaeon RBG_19FT_COMBO_69_17]|nr:MAG: fumarate reductase [Euryarchaeota archaeon RBG_19FT_COMBO_69_17]